MKISIASVGQTEPAGAEGTRDPEFYGPGVEERSTVSTFDTSSLNAALHLILLHPVSDTDFHVTLAL
jgi:hypothetical protein